MSTPEVTATIEAGNTPTPPQPTNTPLPPAVTAAATEELASDPTSEPTAAPTLIATPEAANLPNTEAAAEGIQFVLHAEPNSVQAGDLLTFTAILTNVGPAALNNLRYQDDIPAGLVFQPAASDVITADRRNDLLWTTLPTLAVGQSTTIRYVFRAQGPGQYAETLATNAAQLVLSNGTQLYASADYLYAPPGRSASVLSEQGGVARATNGPVAVHVPPQAFGVGNHAVIFTPHKVVPGVGYILQLELREVQGSNLNAQGYVIDAQRALLVEDAPTFAKPVVLAFDLSGFANLNTLPPHWEAYVATYDEASGVWVNLPEVGMNADQNVLFAPTTHFSLWGAGVFSNTQALLLSDPAPDMFTGATRFSYSFQTPAGPGGLQPNLGLYYASSKVNGILQDVQASWVGLGWDMSQIEILREITNGACEPCGSDNYGYRQEYTLVFNGAGYALLPTGNAGEYKTETSSTLRAVRHSPNLNNAGSVANSTREWWEVFDGSGKVYRLGYNPDAEQLVTMYGYSASNAANSSSRWSALGYAGEGLNAVASRWFLDQVTDGLGHTLTYAYAETVRQVTPYGVQVAYDQATYPNTISYGPYTISFGRQSRGAYDNGPTSTDLHDWSQWESDQLLTITVAYQGAAVRRYVLTYKTDGDPGTHQTLRLAGVTEQGVSVTGTVTSLPSVGFTYTFLNNRLCESAGSDCKNNNNRWPYPRLTSITNGYGGSVVYTYTSDSRASGDGGFLPLSYRLTAMTVDDGQAATPPQQTVYAYGKVAYAGTYKPVYHGCTIRGGPEMRDCFGMSGPAEGINATLSWCFIIPMYDGQQCQYAWINDQGSVVPVIYTYFGLGYDIDHTYWTYDIKEDWGSLLGHEVVTATMLNASGSPEVSTTHYFYTRTALAALPNTPTYLPPHPYQPLAGRAYRVETRDGVGNLLTSQDNNYGVLDISTNPNRWLTYLDSTYSRQNDYGGRPGQSHRVSYTYDDYGHVTGQIDYGWEDYVANPGFENGLANWTPFWANAPVTPTLTATTPFAGRRVLQLQGVITGGVYQDFTGLIPGMTYTVRAWVKAETGSTAQFSLWLNDGVSGNNQQTPPAVYTSTGWSLVSLDYAASATGALRAHLFYANAGNAKAIYVDEVAVARSGNSSDGRTTLNSYLNLSDSRWRIGLPWQTRTYAGTVPADMASTPLAQTLVYYDGATDPFNQTGGITQGLVTRTGKGLWGTSDYVSTTTQYDAWGNPTVVLDARGYPMTITYDAAWHLFPIQTQNAKGHIASTAYDLRLGVPTVVTDVNGNITTYAYDALGRPYEQYRPGDGSDPSVRWTYMDTAAAPQLSPFNVRGQQKPGTFNLGERHFYDGLGREIQTHNARSVTVDGSPNLVDIVSTVRYNALGQVISATLPYTVPATGGAGNPYTTTNLATAPATLTSYDTLGRAVQVTAPDGSTSGMVYGEDTIMALDAAGQPRLTVQDGLGRMVAVNELYTNWRDDFGDMGLAGWAVSGSATEGGGIAQISGNGANILTSTGGTRTGGLISFYYDGTPGLIALRAGTFGTSTYRRWGLTFANGVLSRTSTEGTATAQTLPLLALKTNTWYRVLLRSGEGAQTFVVAVWEKDNPGVSTVWREAKAAWGPQTWSFVAQALGTGPLKVDDFARTDFYQTTYSYDALDQLTQVKDTLNNTTVITYNALGQKIAMNDPDMGVWGYGYDKAGNLTRQTDAKNNTLCFYYDELNRLTGKGNNGSSPTCPATLTNALAGYTYDAGTNGKGLRTGMTDASGWTAWAYSSRGLVVSETKFVYNAGTYSTYFGYDLADRVTSITYPTGEVVTQTYDTAGHFNAMRSATYNLFYASAFTYNPIGQIRQFALGNNTQITYTYDTLARLSNLQATYNSTSLVNFNYRFDTMSNILAITDTVNSGQVQSFTYDSLNRLTAAQTSAVGNGQYNEIYTYDAIGNLLSKAGTSLTYNDTTHKHAATHLNGNAQYTYDANGNMLTRSAGAISQQWDAANRLTQIVSGTQTTQFVYDGNDARVQVTKPDGSKTIYLGGLVELDIVAGVVTTRSNYYAGGQAVAVRTQVTSTNTLNYLLTDHLGSTSVVLNTSGAVVAKQLYAPYGNVRYTTGGLPTQAGFTGQIADAGTGLMYYNARYYDPALGRFISADAIVPGDDRASLKPLTVNFTEAQFLLGANAENAYTLQHGFWSQLSGKEKQQAQHPFGPSNPQTLNRYAYVGNNPVRYTDPSGHDDSCGQDGFIGCVTTTMTLSDLQALINTLTNIQYGTGIAALVLAAGAGLSALSTALIPLSAVLIVATLFAGLTAFEMNYLKEYLNSALQNATKRGDTTVSILFYRTQGQGIYDFGVSVYIQGEAQPYVLYDPLSQLYIALFVQDPIALLLSPLYKSSWESFYKRCLVYKLGECS